MKACHTDSPSSTVKPFTGFVVAQLHYHIHAEEPPSPSSWEILALSEIIELILSANATSDYGPLSIDAFSCYKGGSVLERMLSAKNSAKSSCHDLLIQRSVFLLAANHKTHKVVFNLLVDDRLSSPRKLCEWCLPAAPGKRGPDAWDGRALFVAVSGMAGLFQAARTR